MSQQKKLTGSSAPPALAVAIVGDFDAGPAPFTGATATGATQAAAYPLSAVRTRFGTVAASTGALLPAGAPGDELTVTNFGANSLTVYPPVGGAIDNGAANAGVAVAANASKLFICMDNAGLGYVSK
jgi:hypothetical protein